ncbi:hypothetical protein ACFE04_007673 [Oxalis oulophora]
MSEFFFVNCDVTTVQESESSHSNDHRGDDPVICYIKIIVKLLTYGEHREDYVGVESWPREHEIRIELNKLIDDRTNKEEVEAMLRRESIQVNTEMIDDIVDGAQQMAYDESNWNKKVLHMKVDVIFFDGDLLASDSDSESDSDSDSDSDSEFEFDEEMLENLTRVEFNENLHERECVVCFVEFPLGLIVTVLPCQHNFHNECIESWLRINNSCPLCRLEI